MKKDKTDKKNNPTASKPNGQKPHDPKGTDKYDIRPEQSVELLKELHILTRDGKLNQDSRRKLKQIYHLFQFIEPLLKDVQQQDENFSLVDHGAGKSYLGFILYDLFFKAQEKGTIFGVETRPELIQRSQELAQRLAFPRMKFLNVTVKESNQSEILPEKVHIVTALHACDTATDDAIEFGLQKKTNYFVLIPCCQAEVASFLRKNKADSLSKTPLAELWRHPLHTREIGSLLTNTLRCLLLESRGYQVTVTEFVGLDHSMKNELIIAKYTGQKKSSARTRALEILETCHLNELKDRFCY